MKNSKRELKKVWFSPTSDVGFKILFATPGNENLLVQLLNCILQKENHIEEIVKVELLDPRHTGGELNFFTIFDVYCKTIAGEYIIVEMQNAANSKNFVKRMTVYQAQALLDQAKANWDYNYRRVISIGILNYIMISQSKDAIWTFEMLSNERPEIQLGNDVLQIYVELPKLAEIIDSSTPLSEKFLILLRDLAYLDERPQFAKEPELDNLFRASLMDKLGGDAQKYANEMTTERDYIEWAEEFKVITRAEIEAEVRSELEAKFRSELRSALEAEVRSAVEAEVRSAVEVEVRSAVDTVKNKSNAVLRQLLGAMMDAGLSIEEVASRAGLSVEDLKSVDDKK